MEIYKKRILLVNDQKDTLGFEKQILFDAGYLNVDTDEHPSAIAMLERDHYDLLIQDVQRPLVDGVELYRYMKTHPPLSNIPILLVTAYIALAMGVSKQTAINGHVFVGTFRVDLGNTEIDILTRFRQVKTLAIFYVEGYLHLFEADEQLSTSVSSILKQWDRFENREVEFRLRNRFLWPAVMSAG
jgi:CheY-like chemotaxis protein